MWILRVCVWLCYLPETNFRRIGVCFAAIIMPFRHVIIRRDVFRSHSRFPECCLLSEGQNTVPKNPQQFVVPYFPAHKTHFFPEKCDLNSTCVLCAEGNCYFQTYKYPYIYYTSLYREIVRTSMKMILVAVTTIFWVSVMNKLYYGC